MSSDDEHQPVKSAGQPCIEREPLVDSDNFFEKGIDEMIEELGVSGQIMFALPGEETRETVRLALLSFFLQFLILYFIFQSLEPLTPAEKAKKDLSRLILFSAIYLHVISCVSDWPLYIQMWTYFHELKERYFLFRTSAEDRETEDNPNATLTDIRGNEDEFGEFQHNSPIEVVLSIPVFLFDAFVVPSCTLVLGGLYLCTSTTAPEVIFNSCAVVFITSIDNYVLMLYGKLRAQQGQVAEGQVRVPYMKGMAHNAMTILIDLPIVPLAVSYLIMFVGLDVLGI